MINEISKIVGEKYCLKNDEDTLPFTVDERKKLKTINAVIALVKNVEEIQEIVKLANEKKWEIIPQSGNTGLVGGGIPDRENQIVLSIKRLNKIIDVDVVGNTISVEGGVVLADIQQCAEENNRLFPLALGAQESCMIAGNISTNAGGTNVLSYGNTRELVLGLEVVTPLGEILNLTSKLRKDNTGVDLKNMFIGAEGTLGIITKANLKLFAACENCTTLFIGVEDINHAIEMLNKLKNKFDRNVTAFEAMSENSFNVALDGGQNPLPEKAKWYVLVEINGEVGTIAEVISEKNVVVAQSTQQQKQFWKIRHEMPEKQKKFEKCIKTDIAMPIDKISEFVEATDKVILDIDPDAVIINYGHIGDGNLHYNIIQDAGKDNEKIIIEKIYENVVKLDGTFSAEHGIGQIKKNEMEKYKDKEVLKLMRDIKKVMDPNNIMNPRKIINL